MRTWFTLLALACFLPQQFTCCAQNCGACATPEDSHGVEAPCEHAADDHEHESSAPTHDPSPHHLCVATHLFFTIRGDDAPLLSDFDLTQAIVPTLDAVLVQQFSSPSAAFASLSLPPPNPQRERAVLSVWVI